MRPTTALATTLFLLAAGCTPAQPSVSDARAALQQRMEAARGGQAVQVTRFHAFALSNCAPADPAPGVECDVEMDVSFQYEGREQRSADTDRLRFVREGGRWQVR